ncbi:MAG: helix-turn-helix transcriptional regulator [Oscillospiraceae bacterium]|nr:helix-turn-helix transcriptional regulator [Oscillospiraceae bacterium]
MNNIVEFAKRMKAQREKMGLTQAQLGKKIGVSAQTISAYERNISSDKGKTPTLDKAISISEALGVSLDYLCGTSATLEKGCNIETLRDVAECLISISQHVRCFGFSKRRKLTEEEELVQMAIPPEEQETSIPVAVFTLDNHILAKFLDAKNQLTLLLKNGTLTEDWYNTIIDGQLAGLQSYDVHETRDFKADSNELVFEKLP